MQTKNFSKALVSLLLAALLLFSALPMTAVAAEADAAETGATSVNVSTPEALKNYLEMNGDYVINVTSDIVFTRNSSVIGTRAECVGWAVLGSGKKTLNLGTHLIKYRNEFVAAVTYGSEEDYKEQSESFGALKMFRINSGSELVVNAETTSIANVGTISYEGKLLNNRDGVDQRDIFYVDGGKLTVNGGIFWPAGEGKMYTYTAWNGTWESEQYIQVNGTALTVRSGEAVINGGYFRGLGLEKYDFTRNGAVEVYGSGRVLINGGYFYGDRGAYAVGPKSTGAVVVYSGGFGVDTTARGYGVEKGKSYGYTGGAGKIGLKLNWNTSYQDVFTATRDNTLKKQYTQSEIESDPNVIYNLKEEFVYIEPKSQNPRCSGITKDTAQRMDPYVNGTKTDYDNRYVYHMGTDDTSLLTFDKSDAWFHLPAREDNLRANNIGFTVKAELRRFISEGNRPLVAEGDVAGSIYYDTATQRWTLSMKNILDTRYDGHDFRYYLQPGLLYNIDLIIQENYTPNPGREIHPVTASHFGTIYMRTSQANWTLTFKPGEGDGTEFTVTVPDGESYTFPECTFTAPTDKRFCGWSYIINPEFGYRSGVMPGKTWTITKNYVFTADWVYDGYEIKFIADQHYGKVEENMLPVTVKSGNQYRLPVCTMTPPSGYKFAGWAIHGHSEATQPGDVLTVTSDLTAKAYWTPTEPHVDKVYIMEGSYVSGKNEPHDQEPWEPNKYQMSGYTYWWVCDADGEPVEQHIDSPLVPGTVYQVRYRVEAINGYTIDSDTEYYLDDETKLKYVDKDSYRRVTVTNTFRMPGGEDINSVEATVAAPVAGEFPSYDATVPEGAKYTVNPTNSANYVTGVRWTDMATGQNMGLNKRFEAGHSYKVEIYLTSKYYTFEDGATAKINGADAKVDDADSISMIISYTFGKEDTPALYNVWVGSTRVTDNNLDDILGDGKATYDPATATLTLSDPDIYGTCSAKSAKIYSKDAITIKGSYKMTSAEDVIGLTCDGKLTLDGDFVFIGQYTGVSAEGIDIDGGSIVAQSTKGNEGPGIRSGGLNSNNIIKLGPNVIRFEAIEADERNACPVYKYSKLEVDPALTVTVPEGATIVDGRVITKEGAVADGRIVIENTGSVNREYNLWLGSTQVTDANKADIVGDGKASFDPETNTLTLNEPTITGLFESNKTKIFARGFDLTLKGKYEMTEAEGNNGLYVKGSLILDGDFTFRGTQRGIEADNDITVKSGSIVAAGASEGGIIAFRKLIIENGITRLEADSRSAAAVYGVFGLTVGDKIKIVEPTYGTVGEDTIKNGSADAKHVVLESEAAAQGFIVGDVNESNAVDNRDAMILDRYVAGWDGYYDRILNKDAADMNRDTEITNRDAIILDRVVAGWTGYYEQYCITVAP